MHVLGLVWIPDFVVWMLLLGVAIYLYGTMPFSMMASYGYKGPRPKPFFGNIDLIFGQGQFGAWDLIGKRKYGKVFAMYEGRQPTIVVFDTDMLKQILVKEFATFTDRRDLFLRGDVMIHSLLDVKGQEWKRIRSLNSPFFTTGKVKRNIDLLSQCLNNLKNRCDKNAETGLDVDVKSVVGAYTLEAICLTAFGLHIDSQNDPNHALLQIMRTVTNTVNQRSWIFWLGFAFPFTIPFLEWFGIDMWPTGSIETFSQLTKVAIEDRQKSKTEQPDFIQAMIKAHQVEEELEAEGVSPDSAGRGKALTHKEIVAQVVFFLLAGYDTVSTAVSFLLFNLANNQDCQEKVLQEINDVIGQDEMTYDNLGQMTYLDMCFDESLRLYPPALRNDRKCAKDITINGYFIPKGTLVAIPITGLHHDPEFWSDPDIFDPEHFSSENKQGINPYAYMPFGLGPRNCVGMRLAKIEVKMAVIHIIKHFRVAVGKKTKLPLVITGLFPSVEGGLWLNFEKR